MSLQGNFAVPLFVVLSFFVLSVLDLDLVQADAQAADNRLFYNSGLGFDNTLSGEAIPAEQMIVYVDFNVLKGKDGYVSKLLLECFGQSFQVDQTRVDERGPTDYVWCGKAKDGSISNVVLTINDKIMFGRIEYLDCVYVVEPVEDGSLHRITKLDQTKAMSLENDTLIPPGKLEQEGIVPQGSSRKPFSAALDDGSVIDIMVLYTDGMAATYPGTQIDTKINYLVDLANQAYTNSQINTRLRIVKTQQVSYTDGGPLSTASDELTDGTGVFSTVATWRNTYGADVVTLLRKFQDTNDQCGLAWMMNSGYIDSLFSFAPYAFSVVQEGSRTGGSFCDDYTLAHEVGHNMGCVHDRDNAISPGAYSYSYGYDESGTFATIMSYDNPGVGYFSNPNVLYSGLPMGVPEGQPDSADNAKSINNTKSIVANFRDSVPLPDIKANDSDGPITLGTSDTLLVNISLVAGSNLGVNCDWWVAVNTPFAPPKDWFHFDLSGWIPGLSFTYQGPLLDLGTVEVLNMANLPVGTYTFYFAVDTNRNGVLDIGELFFDFVVVNITL